MKAASRRLAFKDFTNFRSNERRIPSLLPPLSLSRSLTHTHKLGSLLFLLPLAERGVAWTGAGVVVGERRSLDNCQIRKPFFSDLKWHHVSRSTPHIVTPHVIQNSRTRGTPPTITPPICVSPLVFSFLSLFSVSLVSQSLLTYRYLPAQRWRSLKIFICSSTSIGGCEDRGTACGVFVCTAAV